MAPNCSVMVQKCLAMKTIDILSAVLPNLIQPWHMYYKCNRMTAIRPLSWLRRQCTAHFTFKNRFTEPWRNAAEAGGGGGFSWSNISSQILKQTTPPFLLDHLASVDVKRNYSYRLLAHRALTRRELSDRWRRPCESHFHLFGVASSERKAKEMTE